MSLHAILEEFGRDSEFGECSYCPSISDDCKNCKKMLKAINDILALLPEEKDMSKENTCDLLYRPPMRDGETREIHCVNYDERRGWNHYRDTLLKRLK